MGGQPVVRSEVYAYQQKHKWIVHYDDGDIRTHNLTEMTWITMFRSFCAFEVVTRFDMPDHSQKWLHGRIRHSAVEAKKVTYTVEYTGADNKVFDAEIDQDFEKGASSCLQNGNLPEIQSR